MKKRDGYFFSVPNSSARDKNAAPGSTCRVDPAIHLLFEKIERQGAVGENLVVKGAEVEFFAEGFFRLGAERGDLELADSVAQGLSRHGDVAVHFERGGVLAAERGIDQKLNRLRAAPAFAMKSHVDHQPGRAKELGHEPAEILRRLFIKAQIGAEAFGVKRPSFDERRLVGEALKTRQVFLLLLERELKVMAGHGFVKKKRLGSGARLGLDVGGIDVKDAGPRAVRRRRPILRGGGALAKLLD